MQSLWKTFCCRSLQPFQKKRKNSPETIKESPLKLENIIDFLPDATFAINQQGIVIAWNRAIENMTGVRKKEILGKGNFEYALPFYGERRPLLVNLVMRPKAEIIRLYPSLQGENGAYSAEDYFPNVRGQGIFGWAKAAPLRDSSGVVIGAVESILNITDRKAAEENLKSAYDQLKQTQLHLVQAEKMAAVGQLAAGVAHEINNPMAFILSNLSSLQEHYHHVTQLVAAYESLLKALASQNEEAQEAARKQLQKINGTTNCQTILADIPALLSESLDGISRVKKIVTHLKDFAQPDQNTFSATAINDELNKSLLISHNALRHTCSVIREYLQPSPLVMANAYQLNLVFANILTNAAHSIENKGEIIVRTSQDKDLAIIEIQDNGRGIPADHLNKIFDPFFTTQGVGKGTGLGLYVAYNIIKRHKGTISVNSELGKGTQFYITFPLLTVRK